MDEAFRAKGKGRKVECRECGKELAIGSLAGHLAKQHKLEEADRDGSPPSSPQRWDATYYPVEGCYHCLVPGHPQGRDGNGMRESWNGR